MASIQQFDRKRKRGIVWICDIAHSSKYLNRNDTAEPTEEFLQRFLYLSLVAVEASKGEFVKWTGDGFMAWYETPLDRSVGDIVSRVFRAAYELSLYVNVTQLAVSSPVRLRIRHAVTYEKDALVIDLKHSGTMASRDVLGRSVVLAFRLSSLSGAFPSIVTQRELVEACKESADRFRISFVKLRFNREDRLRYFKGEIWGVKNLYASADRQPKRTRTLRSVLRQAEKALKIAESGQPAFDTIPAKIGIDLLGGPQWCQDVVLQVLKYIRGELVPALKGTIELMTKAAAAARSSETGN
jgi:class 3 adenylate cyclase